LGTYFFGGFVKLRSKYAGFGVMLTTIIFLPLLALAQATTASIHGTVADPNGALLANATVTAVNTSTGIVNTQKTDHKGYFVFPDLHIGGPYSITVEDQ
jgi:hypothetical protein